MNICYDCRLQFHNVLSISLLAAAVKIDSRRPLEHICMPTLYLLATAKHFVWCHKKPVLRKKRGHCGGVVLLVCLIQLSMKVTELTYGLGSPP